MSQEEVNSVLELLLEDNSEADRLSKFMERFPEHAASARLAWEDMAGEPWED